MSKQTRLYKVIRKGKETTSILPGRFAGNKPGKIFGRLDCKTGIRLMKKENRVFFLTWEDAVAAGYRACKNCRPFPDDSYPNHQKIRKAVEAQPHIALLKSSRPPRNRRPGIAWCVYLNWEENNENQRMSCQIPLSETFGYQRARSVAIALGKKYNLPTLQHGEEIDFTVLSEPTQRPNDIEAARDRRTVKELQNGKHAIKLSSIISKK